MISNWKTNKISQIGDFRIFTLNSARRINPVSGKEGEFYFIDSPKWVNIIPITEDRKVVFVEQYRHGTDSVTIEIPAGLVEKGEDTQLAAKRECEEECGFRGDGLPELLGVNSPNPAFLNNKCYSYVWHNCTKQFEQNLDTNEVIDIHLIDIDTVKKMIMGGEINHSLVLTAFLFYSLKYKF